jgi:hypothetical protein
MVPPRTEAYKSEDDGSAVAVISSQLSKPASLGPHRVKVERYNLSKWRIPTKNNQLNIASRKCGSKILKSYTTARPGVLDLDGRTSRTCISNAYLKPADSVWLLAADFPRRSCSRCKHKVSNINTNCPEGVHFYF